LYVEITLNYSRHATFVLSTLVRNILQAGLYGLEEVWLETPSWTWTFLALLVLLGLLLLLLWQWLLSRAEVFTTLPAHNGKQKA